jgi:hypothetical protein
MTLGFDPTGRPLNELLGDLTMPIEEQKADLLGLTLLTGLVKHGDMPMAEFMEVAKMYVADMIYTTYRDPHEAHGKFQVAAYNMLKERGAIVYDDATGRMTVTDKFPEAVREVTGVFLGIQERGDRAAADKLLSEHGTQAPEVAKTLELLTAQNQPRRTSYKTTLVK